MNPNRTPKHCYCSTAENSRAQHTTDKHSETLKEMEQKIDAGAAHIGLVIADIFTFLTKSAAMLPDMELHTDVDVRTGSKWYGDETKGNSTVTSDFYSYFSVSKSNEPLMKGIDVSVHNGSIDWQKVKNAGIQFAILRAGYGRELSQKDARFEENYKNAKAAGTLVGAYWYSYAMSEDEARLEANVFLSVIKGKQFEMPVYFDLEEKKQFDLGKEKVSAIMRAWQNTGS